MNVLYCTPQMKIGKHWWRCRVQESDAYGAVWMYQWRRDDGPVQGPAPVRWYDMEQWHTYNSNASDNGLPKTIVTLYRRHEWEIWDATIRAKEAWLAANKTGPYAWRWENTRQDLERDKERFARMRPPASRQSASVEGSLFQQQKGSTYV